MFLKGFYYDHNFWLPCWRLQVLLLLRLEGSYHVPNCGKCLLNFDCGWSIIQEPRHRTALCRRKYFRFQHNCGDYPHASFMTNVVGNNRQDTGKDKNRPCSYQFLRNPIQRKSHIIEHENVVSCPAPIEVNLANVAIHTVANICKNGA